MKEGASVNLRIVASQPTRIELYDGAGRFAMADAEGNGSLAESGDQLGWDVDRDGWPEITFNEQGEAKILLYAQALQPIPAAGVEITVEWKIDGKWVPVATDQLMLFNRK
jgi:hypothetical protein